MRCYVMRLLLFVFSSYVCKTSNTPQQMGTIYMAWEKQYMPMKMATVETKASNDLSFSVGFVFLYLFFIFILRLPPNSR